MPGAGDTPPEERCPICNKPVGPHRPEDHAIRLVSEPGEPLAFTIDVQGYTSYEEQAAKARMLARARRELRDFFNRREFEILPSFMLSSNLGGKSAFDSRSNVAVYIAIET